MKRQVKKFYQFIRESREEDFGPEITGGTMGDYDDGWDEDEAYGEQTELQFPGEEFSALICLGTATDAIEMKFKQIFDGLGDAKFSTGGYYVKSDGKLRAVKGDHIGEQINLIKQGKLKDKGQLYYALVVRKYKKIPGAFPGYSDETEAYPLRMEDIENFADGWWADWCANNDCKDPQIRVFDSVTGEKVATL